MPGVCLRPTRVGCTRLTPVLDAPLPTVLLAVVGAITVLVYAMSLGKFLFSIAVQRGMSVSSVSAISLLFPLAAIAGTNQLLRHG